MNRQTETATLSPDSLPIDLGIRLALDSVSFSNPLPYWVETMAINHSNRRQVIRSKIVDYLAGANSKAVFSIEVPKKNGKTKRWIVPSVNDQIVMQTCVSSISADVYSKTVNRQRVFSYRYNRDPNKLALVEDHVSNWNEFQNETRQRCNSNECILQLDIADAFGSIRRPQLAGFLTGVLPGRLEVNLITTILDSLLPGDTGLPLINDSLFFLGNVYLTEVDRLIETHTTNFIRFVDDYRIFANSREELSHLLEVIGVDLKHLGFEINFDKVKLGTGQEYLDAISNLRYSGSADLVRRTPEAIEYVDAAMFADMIKPGDLANLVQKTVENPNDHLNEGLGRLQLAALRKLRINDKISCERNYIRSVRNDFSKELSSRADILQRVNGLLNQYAWNPQEAWRSIWLLYLCQDIDSTMASDASIAKTLRTTILRIREDTGVPPAVRLWAQAPFKDPKEQEIEQLHDREYIESAASLKSKYLPLVVDTCGEEISSKSCR
jgi:hypothetical protein